MSPLAAVVIRPGRAADVRALDVIELSGAETFVRFGRPLADDGGPPASPDRWLQAIDAGQLWVAEHAHDGPIGFVAVELADGGLYVSQVDVHMTHQQHGHGRRLMQTAIAWAQDQGLAAVTLTTFRDIPWNAPFYAKLGFVELSDAEMPPHLAGHLAEEAASGFENRCGMRLAL